MEFTMEQVLPIVEELTGRQTGLQSTSVTYEKARQLMEAVLYTLEQGQTYKSSGNGDRKTENGLIHAAERTEVPWKLYHAGQQVIREKTEQAEAVYRELMTDFRNYGSTNYKSTVENAIPGFFKWYDELFYPQGNVITYDYPVLCDLSSKRGADRMLSYIKCIQAEQEFLRRLPAGYVEDSMRQYDPRYEAGMDNLCGIIMERLLGRFKGSLEERFDKVLEGLGIENGSVRDYLSFGKRDWQIRILL